MNYAKLISSVITALTYGLEIGICIGDQFLELDEKGFYFIKGTNSEENPSERGEKHYLSIPNVINFLFKRIISLGDSSLPLIVYMIDYLDCNNIKDVTSYIEIVDLIKKIKSQKPNKDKKGVSINFDYGRLKVLISKIPKNTLNSFLTEIISVGDLSYEEIGNISLLNSSLMGRLEKMSQLERCLERYCKTELAKHLIGGKKGYDYRTDQLGLLNGINLNDFETEWEMFYNIVDNYNYIEMLFLRSQGNNSTQTGTSSNDTINLSDIDNSRQLLLEPNQ